ncbi:unnamed protein product, partial [Protopolystoma xenopodis]
EEEDEDEKEPEEEEEEEEEGGEEEEEEGGEEEEEEEGRMLKPVEDGRQKRQSVVTGRFQVMLDDETRRLVVFDRKKESILSDAEVLDEGLFRVGKKGYSVAMPPAYVGRYVVRRLPDTGDARLFDTRTGRPVAMAHILPNGLARLPDGRIVAPVPVGGGRYRVHPVDAEAGVEGGDALAVYDTRTGGRVADSEVIAGLVHLPSGRFVHPVVMAQSLVVPEMYVSRGRFVARLAEGGHRQRRVYDTHTGLPIEWTIGANGDEAEESVEIADVFMNEAGQPTAVGADETSGRYVIRRNDGNGDGNGNGGLQVFDTRTGAHLPEARVDADRLVHLPGQKQPVAVRPAYSRARLVAIRTAPAERPVVFDTLIGETLPSDSAELLANGRLVRLARGGVHGSEAQAEVVLAVAEAGDRGRYRRIGSSSSASGSVYDLMTGHRLDGEVSASGRLFYVDVDVGGQRRVALFSESDQTRYIVEAERVYDTWTGQPVLNVDVDVDGLFRLPSGELRLAQTTESPARRYRLVGGRLFDGWTGQQVAYLRREEGDVVQLADNRSILLTPSSSSSGFAMRRGGEGRMRLFDVATGEQVPQVNFTADAVHIIINGQPISIPLADLTKSSSNGDGDVYSTALPLDGEDDS